MKISKGSHNVVLKPDGGVHAIKTVCLDQDPYIKMLLEMRPIDIARLREADRIKSGRTEPLLGVPYYFGFEYETQILLFYPAANQDYTVAVRYFPAVREL